MTSLSEKRPGLRLIVVLLVAALVSVPCQAIAFASETDDAASSTPLTAERGAAVMKPVAGDAPLTIPTIRGTALRLALAESRRLERNYQSTPGSSDRCTASVAEKLAWLYAVAGGALMLAYGPREKEGAVWTNDGKSETVAGAAAIALSFALLHDIRKKAR